MQKLFRKKYLISSLILISLVALTITITHISTQASDSKSEGSRIAGFTKEINNRKTNDVKAIINGTNVTQNHFDYIKATFPTLSDDQIYDKITKTIVEYNEAVKNGITVTDDEVNKFIEVQKKALIDSGKNPSDTFSSTTKSANGSTEYGVSGENSYEIYQGFLKASGMTEDEYWLNTKDLYKKQYIIGKYRYNLRKIFEKNNNITDNNELSKKFNEYYNNLTQNQISKANIVKIK